MSFAIRPYHPSDLYSLYRICLLTADSGQDASQIYTDQELVGHYYAAPYGVYEPETCFILTLNAAPVGYILAAPDTIAFWERMERDWLPVLRVRYPAPAETDTSRDASMIRAIHHQRQYDQEWLSFFQAYPAHLHIDLLPVAQGQGWGRKMVHTLRAKLHSLGVPAVHLGVGSKNTGGIAFYEKTGFKLLQDHETYKVYGIATSR